MYRTRLTSEGECVPHTSWSSSSTKTLSNCSNLPSSRWPGRQQLLSSCRYYKCPYFAGPASAISVYNDNWHWRQGGTRVPTDTATAQEISITNASVHELKLPNDNAHDQSSAVQCMLELEKYLHLLIFEWYEAYLPMPFTVKIVNNSFHVIMTTIHIHGQPKWRQEATFTCNGSKARKKSQ